MAFLRAFGLWLPSHRVTNSELASALETSPEWILEATGIEERRYASSDDTIASIGILAAQDCLQKAGATAQELGMILVASGSSDRFCTGPASQIALGLGLNSTPALDIPVASCGSLIALVLAAQCAPAMGRVLIIGSEIMSRRISCTPASKDTAILFGDGAGACLIDAEIGFARIADSCLYTDGEGAELLKIENGQLRMDGLSVILHASRKIPRAITELLRRNNIPAAHVGIFLLHQANLNLIQRTATFLKVPQERFFANIARYGNTSSASLLIAAAEWHQSHTAAPLTPLIFSAFGAGLNWGALLAISQ